MFFAGCPSRFSSRLGELIGRDPNSPSRKCVSLNEKYRAMIVFARAAKASPFAKRFRRNRLECRRLGRLGGKE